LKYYSGIYPGLRKTAITSLKVAGVSGEIQNEHLPNSSLEYYRFGDLLGIKLSCNMFALDEYTFNLEAQRTKIALLVINLDATSRSITYIITFVLSVVHLTMLSVAQTIAFVGRFISHY
jgi:hypothetical protein